MADEQFKRRKESMLNDNELSIEKINTQLKSYIREQRKDDPAEGYYNEKLENAQRSLDNLKETSISIKKKFKE